MAFSSAKILSILGITFFLSSFLFSQVQISGQVVELSSGNPLPFVHISTLNQQKGTLSDLDGNFSLEIEKTGDSLFFSLLGFEKIHFATVSNVPNWKVRLKEKDVELDEVMITSDFDPALRIMRKVLANRKKNNIKALPAYSYQSYNKIRMLVDSAGLHPDSSKRDSLLIANDLFIWESVTQVDYRSPGKLREEVLASKTAGYPGRVLPLSAGDLQSLTLYDNYLNVLGDAFLSPISPEGLNRYQFQLEETFPEGKDSLFVLSFKPKKARQKGMDGLLFIRSGKWALQSVRARLLPGSNPLIFSEGSIRQIYRWLNDSVCFPIQLNTDIQLLPMQKGNNLKLILSGRSYFSKINLQSDLKARQFSAVTLRVSPKAADLSEQILVAARIKPLSEKEIRGYIFMDSIGKRSKLPWIYDQFGKLQFDRIGLGPIDFDLNRIWVQTGLEYMRTGLGLLTNEKLLRWVEVGGYAAYGFRDREWKYGGSLQFKPFRSNWLVLGGNYDHDLKETGFERLEIGPERPLYRRKYQDVWLRLQYVGYLDYVDRIRGYLFLELPKNVSLLGEYSTANYEPGLSYSFQNVKSFPIDEVAVTARWAPGEKFSQAGEFRLRQTPNVPVLRLRWRKGLGPKDFGNMGGAYAYQQIDASFQHRFFVKGRNLFSYQINAGYTQDAVPYPKMYVFRGNKRWNGSLNTDVGYAFNTMRMNEFAANQYATAFIGWRSAESLIKSGPFRPVFSFVLKSAWGRLLPGTDLQHRPVRLQGPEEGYFEGGILVQGLFPKPKQANLWGTALAQLGVGVYYRFGAYGLAQPMENFAFRLTTFTF